jgi:broad specificity phosphatase PhoE
MAATIRSDLFELGGCYSGHLPSQKIGQPGMGRSDLSNGYPEWSVDPRIAESGWWGRPFESQSEASQRAVQVQRWLETEVCDDSRHLDLLVIHADFKRVLILQLLGTHWSQEHSEQLGDLFNTGISNLQFSQGRWVMNCYNSTFHLASDEVTS